jgi:integrase
MKKSGGSEVVECEFFRWCLRVRNGVWQADGRGNKTYPGRHSLGTTDRDEALSLIPILDLHRAVDLGLAEKERINTRQSQIVKLQDGVDAYFKHLGRSKILGGVQKETVKRYKAMLDKFLPFCESNGVTSWNGVQGRLLENYAAWLDEREYAAKTQGDELTTIKQLVKYLVREKLLPPEAEIRLPIKKVAGARRHCYTQEQVRSMLELCNSNENLHWLRDVIQGLSHTGMRISELLSLRASDIDLRSGFIVLTDDRGNSVIAVENRRQLKNGKSRRIPILEELRPLLVRLVARYPKGKLFRGPKEGVLLANFVRERFKADVRKPLSERFSQDRDDEGFAGGCLHSFRHFFCSVAANSGVPERTVMEWLGHSSSDMVRVYFHLSDQDAKLQAQRLSNSFKFES